MHALTYIGCLASETWTSARCPIHRQPFGMRHSSVLDDGEPASRMKKWVCLVPFASVRGYVLGYNPSLCLALPLWLEMSHHLENAVAGPMSLHAGKRAVNGRAVLVLGLGNCRCAPIVKAGCAFADLSLAGSPSKAERSPLSRSRIQPIHQTETLHADDGT